MKLFTLQREQYLDISLEEAWEYFSSPKNLKELTPDFMGFDVIHPRELDRMYPGMIIEYQVKPILSIPIQWVTEITHVNEPYYFVDEQRFGPYSFWHHKHFFRQTDKKKKQVHVMDVVHYALPLGFLGSVINSLIVARKLALIFDYRYSKLEELFNSNS